jgi:hypothetical protein
MTRRPLVATGLIALMRGGTYGAYGMAFFGTTRAQSAAIRTTVTKLFGGFSSRASTGFARNVAWLVAPSNRASDAAASAAKRVYLSCVV